MLSRLLVALAALLVAGWLAGQLRDAVLADGVKQTVIRNKAQLSPRQLVDLDRRLRRAALLNPDTTPLQLRTALALVSGNRARAARLAEAEVRDEPDNLSAWQQLVFATRGRDPARAAEARRQQKRLSPLTSP